MMGIYERDYKTLTIEEVQQWNDLKLKEVIYKKDNMEVRRNLFREYPKAIRHHTSLFPNNYMDIEDLQKKVELEVLADKFLEMLDSQGTPERTVLNWIRDNRAYFIIASILNNYNFGHHSAFIFPELQLGTSYKVDFLIVGKNSGGYEYVFVELEARYGKITMADGELGEVFRKGIRQVNDWSEWLENHFGVFHEVLQKHKNPEQQLPLEFLKPDRTRMHYVVVAGRRADFNDRTYRIKRRTKEEQKIELLHYDNLYDYAKSVIGNATY